MNIPKCSTCRRWKKEYWCIECNYEAKDLVDVVRCKDCKHYSNGHLCRHFSRYGTIETKETNFCSFGERRAEQ